MARPDDDAQRRTRPLIEWVVAGISLLITIALVGTIGWKAMQGPPTKPQIALNVTSITASGENYLVEFSAFNHGDQTVAGVTVEGRLTVDGRETEVKQATLDYVPGRSQTKGGLFFRSNPRRGDLQVTASGYQLP
jgi:uncharacterized protein (TIGR02588 family)